MSTMTFYATTATGTFSNLANATGNTPTTYASITKGLWGNGNIVLGFNFSALPDNAVITKVTLGMSHKESVASVLVDQKISCNKFNLGRQDDGVYDGIFSNTGYTTQTTTTTNVIGTYVKSDLTGLTLTMSAEADSSSRTWYVYFGFVTVEYTVPGETHNLFVGETQVSKICLGEVDITSLLGEISLII